MLALLCSQFIPGALMLVPLFEIFKNLRMINSLGSVVIAETVFQLPLSIILISGFIKNVPVSLEEAAWVDGCSRLRAFCAVVLPLLRPGLIAVGSFAFVHSWNHFLFALMFLSEQDKQTIPVGLNTLIGADSVDLGALAAGGVIAAVPVVIVFAFIQKWLITGFSSRRSEGLTRMGPMNTHTTALPIVLAGARGHGRWHLANIRRLQDRGLVRLAGVCELNPLSEESSPPSPLNPPSSRPTSGRSWTPPGPAPP